MSCFAYRCLSCCLPVRYVNSYSTAIDTASRVMREYLSGGYVTRTQTSTCTCVRPVSRESNLYLAMPMTQSKRKRLSCDVLESQAMSRLGKTELSSRISQKNPRSHLGGGWAPGVKDLRPVEEGWSKYKQKGNERTFVSAGPFRPAPSFSTCVPYSLNWPYTISFARLDAMESTHSSLSLILCKLPGIGRAKDSGDDEYTAK
jgi:hypothetical protein